jgi:hypothetical protein
MLDKEKAESPHWDCLLVETINKIRLQKQRPSLDRIYKAVRILTEKNAEITQNFPFVELSLVQQQLDRVVKDGLLLKLLYKGQTTYKTKDKCETVKLHNRIGENEGISNKSVSTSVLSGIDEEKEELLKQLVSESVSSLLQNINTQNGGITFTLTFTLSTSTKLRQGRKKNVVLPNLMAVKITMLLKFQL